MAINPNDITWDESPAISQQDITWDKPIAQAPSPSVGDRLKRQLGLTGRYLTEGVVGTGDILTSPIRALQNAIMPSNLQARPLAEVLTRNLPQPETTVGGGCRGSRPAMECRTPPLGLCPAADRPGHS